ncbi:MAG: hypothetical protein V3R90_00035, partial [Limibaculum sp.]
MEVATAALVINRCTDLDLRENGLLPYSRANRQRAKSRTPEAQSAPFAGALKREKNMLQALAHKFHRCARAILLPVVVIAVI